MMVIYFRIFILGTILVSVFNKETLAQTTKKKTTVIKKTVSTKAEFVADIEAGKALIQKADCMTCHKVDIKLVGPAFKQVAAKYPATEDNYASLAARVIAGGSGVWGQIPMAPHSALSPADAKKMTKYILSLK